MAQAKPNYSKPIFEQSFTINSLQAQRVVDRVFRRTVSALYGIDVILRIIGDENEIDEVEDIISHLIEDCAKAVDNEQARLDKLMESNGIDEVPDYTDPITFNAKISSPQVGQFVGLVRKLDALMISMDTLWLSSVLSNKQRVDGNYAWQQRIIKLARRIIDIEIRARKSAQAKGKEAEVEQAVPSTDDDITEEETDNPTN
ncbi:hypothetical protein [Vibrio diabolicus]|uniref:hypothetical protein n=1 Tax=Vibrio diabolicus TaxID=50719 RepID=UPI0024940B0C|nr:hypothetical protein [Vibrio diabolicus]